MEHYLVNNCTEYLNLLNVQIQLKIYAFIAAKYKFKKLETL